MIDQIEKMISRFESVLNQVKIRSKNSLSEKVMREYNKSYEQNYNFLANFKANARELFDGYEDAYKSRLELMYKMIRNRLDHFEASTEVVSSFDA